ncbi:MAG: helix-turn-helix transcriptional regulator [Elusimicrobia bacterium]|nr:helix-turn-helix transcriptional regulator [Elusimicrobiota bacterium]
MTSGVKAFRKKLFGRESVCRKVLVMFGMLSNKTRFRIVCLLMEGDFCVQEITDAIEAGETSFVSQQLKAFHLAGIVAKKKVGRKVYYRLADPKLRELIRFLGALYLENKPGGVEK